MPPLLLLQRVRELLAELLHILFVGKGRGEGMMQVGKAARRNVSLGGDTAAEGRHTVNRAQKV